MRTETRDGGPERRVLINFITQTTFLARVVPKWKTDLFASRWTVLIAGWCVEHYKKYQSAPGKQIVSYFEEWSRATGDTDSAKLVEGFLASVSTEYDQTGTENFDLNFSVSEAEALFNEVAVIQHQEDLRTSLSRGDVKGAVERIQQFKRIELNRRAPVDVLRDKDAQRRAIEQKARVLISMPDGPLRVFFGREFCEGSLVAFAAQAKGGKSYTLLEFAWRALLQGRRVAYFQVGDMTEEDVMARFQARAARRPLESGSFRWPISLEVGEDYEVKVERDVRSYDQPLTTQEGQAAYERVLGRTKGSLRLMVHPIMSVTIQDVAADLETWDREGWRAEIVVLDYLENLLPVDKRAAPVEQVSQTWAYSRRVSETRNCCFMTAHQGNKESYKTRVLTRSNFRGSLMTLAHPTAFIGINQMDEEKEQDVIRYNFMVRRKQKFRETTCLTVASCLDVAQAIVLATFRRCNE